MLYNDSDVVTGFLRDVGIGGMGRFTVEKSERVERGGKVTQAREEFRAGFVFVKGVNTTDDDDDVPFRGSEVVGGEKDIVKGVREWRNTEYNRACGILGFSGGQGLFVTPEGGERERDRGERCREFDEDAGGFYYDVGKRIVEEGRVKDGGGWR